jgi:hypothetical protein
LWWTTGVKWQISSNLKQKQNKQRAPGWNFEPIQILSDVFDMKDRKKERKKY